MPLSFAYRVVDHDGRRTRGVGQADSAEGMTSLLESRGLLVLDVERVASSTAAAAARARVGRRDVLELSRGLAALLSAGLPLSRALSITAHIVPERVRGLLEDIAARTTRGDSLATALDAHGAEFPSMYRGVVRAGERSGDLARAFAALTKQLEAEDRLRARLLSASIYPLLLALGGIITSAVLVLVVLPRFAELLAGAQAKLPRSTAALLAISSALRRGWPVLLVLVLVLIAIALAGRRSTRLKYGMTAALLRLPIVGQLRRYTLGARFARLTGVLLEGGAPLLTALDDVLSSIANPVAQDEIKRVRSRVHDGVALHRAVAEGALFPPVVARLVAVGEESGRLEELLISAAELCEERAERILQRLVALAEPAMILVFGVLVAFVALSLLQALYGIDAGAFR